MAIISRALRNNPFWPYIREVLDSEGYTNYRPEQRHGGKFDVIIETIAGPKHYTFAQRGEDFTALNFKARFRNWVRSDLRDKGIKPLGAVPDAPKPVQVLKTPARVEAERIFSRPREVPITPPVAARVDEPAVSPTVVSSPAQSSSPSDHDTAIVMSINGDNLATVLDLLRGVAKLIRSGPLQTTTAAARPAAVAQPQPVAEPVLTPRQAPTPAPRFVAERMNLSDAIIAAMEKEPNKYYTKADLMKRVSGFADNSFGATLSTLSGSGKLTRVAHGIYMLPKNHVRPQKE